MDDSSESHPWRVTSAGCLLLGILAASQGSMFPVMDDSRKSHPWHRVNASRPFSGSYQRQEVCITARVSPWAKYRIAPFEALDKPGQGVITAFG